MKFIKVTGRDNPTPMFINAAAIFFMFRDLDFTKVWLSDSDGDDYLRVNETPEQILELIKAAE